MAMSDQTANKIRYLEIINNILKSATDVAGVIGSLNFFIPTPIANVEKTALTAITTLLSLGARLVDNKIDTLANESDFDAKRKEVTKLGDCLKGLVENMTMKEQVNAI